MKVYNTLTRQKEEFVPIENGKVKMYVCGPTVYDFIHIGNARPYVVFDTIRRYLEYKGFEVNYVQNFTDIDDKIINRANKEKIKMQDVSQKYIKEAIIDATRLNVKTPTKNPKVTDEIEEIINFIKVLINKKYAYEIDGTVFFDTKAFNEYGKLSKKVLEELEIGSRVKFDETKKNSTDFVLWKPKKENEPFWTSPWSDGRPGWHIECSAMAKKYLGEQIDIHAGGADLIFPHHENEIAQSEACTGKQFAKYWLHNGFINVDNEKMSKSKGNFFTLRDIVKEIPYDVIRFFILSTHYRNPINFSKELIESSKNGLERIKNCIKNLNYFLDNNKTKDILAKEEVLLEKVNVFRFNFEKFMDDDFNTADAISVIFEFVKFINTNITEENSAFFVSKVLNELTTLIDVLAILYKQDDEKIIDIEEIEKLIEKRNNAKKNKDFVLADKIRHDLKQKGIILEDTRNGVRWSKE